ncbi:MAG: flagellar protein FliT [Chloroflexi bacterium]|nr:flagellar protein FliT [Chloroflexota bacterium]
MLGMLLARLRTIVQAQAEALLADDFDRLEVLIAQREPLVADLSSYGITDLSVLDRALAEQVAALDQQLLALVRESLDRTGQEMRDVERGRTALAEYRRRGQTLIRNLAYLGQHE